MDNLVRPQTIKIGDEANDVVEDKVDNVVVNVALQMLVVEEVAMLALPKEDFLNPGKKAQNLEGVVVHCTSVH